MFIFRWWDNSICFLSFRIALSIRYMFLLRLFYIVAWALSANSHTFREGSLAQHLQCNTWLQASLQMPLTLYWYSFSLFIASNFVFYFSSVITMVILIQITWNFFHRFLDIFSSQSNKVNAPFYKRPMSTASRRLLSARRFHTYISQSISAGKSLLIFSHSLK